MKGGDTAGVNAMIAGNRVNCVIGFVSVMDFSLLTQVLQGGVMTFVNQIAEIVHGCSNEFHGAANRNTGEMFLVIWRGQEAQREIGDRDSSGLGKSMLHTSMAAGDFRATKSATSAAFQRLP